MIVEGSCELVEHVVVRRAEAQVRPPQLQTVRPQALEGRVRAVVQQMAVDVEQREAVRPLDRRRGRARSSRTSFAAAPSSVVSIATGRTARARQRPWTLRPRPATAGGGPARKSDTTALMSDIARLRASFAYDVTHHIADARPLGRVN